jgi:hypothetical protein
LTLHRARQEVRDGHNDRFRLIYRKLDRDLRAVVIQKLKTDIRSVCRHLASCQLVAANFHNRRTLFTTDIFGYYRYIRQNIAPYDEVRQ